MPRRRRREGSRDGVSESRDDSSNKVVNMAMKARESGHLTQPKVEWEIETEVEEEEEEEEGEGLSATSPTSSSSPSPPPSSSPSSILISPLLPVTSFPMQSMCFSIVLLVASAASLKVFRRDFDGYALFLTANGITFTWALFGLITSAYLHNATKLAGGKSSSVHSGGGGGGGDGMVVSSVTVVATRRKKAKAYLSRWPILSLVDDLYEHTATMATAFGIYQLATGRHGTRSMMTSSYSSYSSLYHRRGGGGGGSPLPLWMLVAMVLAILMPLIGAIDPRKRAKSTARRCDLTTHYTLQSKTHTHTHTHTLLLLLRRRRRRRLCIQSYVLYCMHYIMFYIMLPTPLTYLLTCSLTHSSPCLPPSHTHIHTHIRMYVCMYV